MVLNGFDNGGRRRSTLKELEGIDEGGLEGRRPS
jgi:hypothetical protein